MALRVFRQGIARTPDIFIPLFLFIGQTFFFSGVTNDRRDQTAQARTVKEVVDRFKKGNLRPTSEATVGNHFGLSDGAGVGQALIKGRLQLENLELRESLKKAQPVPFIVGKSKTIIQV